MIAVANTIAVFGATGQQGGAVVDALLERNANVRALARDPQSERAQALAARGVELVRADAEDSASLERALIGVDAFYFMTTSPGPGETQDVNGERLQGESLADAAHAAKVPRIVYSSVGGAERDSGIPHFESKRRVEEHLEGLGAPATFVRPVFFMDNFWSMARREDDGIVVRIPLPDGIKLQLISTRDIGHVAAIALLDIAEIPERAIEIAGDELTGSEIACAFAEHTGLPARYEPIPLEALDGMDSLQAMFRWNAQPDSYQADIESVRTVHPGLQDLLSWLADTGFRARG